LVIELMNRRRVPRNRKTRRRNGDGAKPRHGEWANGRVELMDAVDLTDGPPLIQKTSTPSTQSTTSTRLFAISRFRSIGAIAAMVRQPYAISSMDSVRLGGDF
jgi:hypothetical protein